MFTKKEEQFLRHMFHNMHTRCRLSEHYRDIEVCEEWHSFEAFKYWVRYTQPHWNWDTRHDWSLARHFDFGNYCAENCAIVPKSENKPAGWYLIENLETGVAEIVHNLSLYCRNKKLRYSRLYGATRKQDRMFDEWRVTPITPLAPIYPMIVKTEEVAA